MIKKWPSLYSFSLLSPVNWALLSALPVLTCAERCTGSHGDVCSDPPWTRITCTCVYLSLIHRHTARAFPLLLSDHDIVQVQHSSKKNCIFMGHALTEISKRETKKKKRKNPAHVRLKLGRRKHIVQVQCTVSAESCVLWSFYWCFFSCAEYGCW